MTIDIDNNLVGKESPSDDNNYPSPPRDNNGNSSQINPSKDLDPYIQDRDYVEFIVKTIKRTVRCEDTLVRQIVYTGLSKDSANPINLAVLAPTSEGKTYPVLETIRYFPKQDVWKVGSMSPKVIIRQNGILVDNDNEPLDSRIKDLKKQIRSCKDDDEEKAEELKEQLHQIYQEAKVMIDLRSKVLIFLEPPHKETWSILKPILSHDDYEIEHPYVYEVEGMGFKVKKVVTRGWPACIFCSAKNESNWPEWPEIQSRFLITSPNMISQKYLEGNILIAQQAGLPKSLQRHLIVSDEDVEIAKKCILYLTQQLKEKSEKSTTKVWMPFARTLAKILPADKGTDNRFTKRLFSFTTIITLSKTHMRNRLEIGEESLVIANLENDLVEALKITYNLSGIPPFKLKLFTEILLPLFKAKKTADKNKDGDKEERVIALTTSEIYKEYKLQTGKTISTNNLKKTYIDEFLDNGIMEQETSVINAKQNIYYPIVDVSPSSFKVTANNGNGDSCGYKEREEREQKHKSLSTLASVDNDLRDISLILSKNFKDIPENWLELEISTLFSYPLKLGNFALHDNENKHICIQNFNDYQKSVSLSGQGFRPIFCNFDKEIFGKVKYLGIFCEEEYKPISTGGKVDNDLSNMARATAVTKNIVYSQQVILTNKRNQTVKKDTSNGKIINATSNIISDNLTLQEKK